MGSTEGGGLRRGHLPDANVALAHFPGVFTWMKKTSCSLKWGRKSHDLSLWSFSLILMYVFGNIFIQLPNPQFCRLPPSQHACIPSFDEFDDESAQLVSVFRQQEVSSKLGSVGTENQINFVSVAITIIVSAKYFWRRETKTISALQEPNIRSRYGHGGQIIINCNNSIEVLATLNGHKQSKHHGVISILLFKQI